MFFKKLMVSKKWIYLPVETKVRELDAKVLVACCAAEQGFAAFLGPNGFNLSGAYPPGVYVDKSISPNKSHKILNQVTSLGNVHVCLDEEGLVFIGNEYVDERLSTENLKQTKMFFCWGHNQYSHVLNAYPSFTSKIKITGSPRVDLWRPPLIGVSLQKAKQITDKQEKFILIVSNFSASNHAMGERFVEDQYSAFMGENKEKEEEFALRLRYHRSIFKKFCADIQQVFKDNPEKKFILRPHPGDDMGFWKNLESKVPNLKCIYDGNLGEWIASSEFIIHNNCTSAVEAFAMKKNAIAYIPIPQNKDYELNIPNDLSIQAFSISTLQKYIDHFWSDNVWSSDEKRQNIFNTHISVKTNQFSADRLIDEIKNLKVPEVSVSFFLFVSE